MNIREYMNNASSNVLSVLFRGLAEATVILISFTISLLAITVLITFIYLIGGELPNSPLDPVAPVKSSIIFLSSVICAVATISIQSYTDWFQRINSFVWNKTKIGDIDSEFWKNQDNKYKEIYDEYFLLNFLLVFAAFLFLLGYVFLYLGQQIEVIHVSILLLFVGIFCGGIDAGFLQIGVIGNPESRRRQEVLSSIMSQIEVIFTVFAIIFQFGSTLFNSLSNFFGNVVAVLSLSFIPIVYIYIGMKISNKISNSISHIN